MNIKKRVIKHKKEIFIILISILLITGIFLFFQEYSERKIKFCNKDSDCIPASCCHADSCVNKKNAPNCEGIFCTQECSGSLDCGEGYCRCIKNKCEVIPD